MNGCELSLIVNLTRMYDCYIVFVQTRRSICQKLARQVTEKFSGEPEADQFRAGDVWESPRGVRHTITRVSNGVAHMVNENTHRTANRAYDALGWGHSGRPWVRISSGAEVDKS
ncbi:protein of unknown function [Acidithiobacillus ferrivorans]|uniref:Uncharacterized protein n=1 Tax=Acidithiobacillus ferrivorans TaxID=160808 RepID=A0A060UUX8_9PROT|nr:hypothetical protein AFERRI_400334 [Acidithiobacillus ferrivorans]SMH64584.1 protein of unknown function [Acidithiobacillus ferrivorans]